jgi:DNA-binding IclR family transcriptional regulator
VPLSHLGQPLIGRIEMKQLDIFDTDYESCNYTDTSQQALATIKPKIKTKREQVYDFVKLQSSTNYEISDELEMPLSSVCGRVHELQELNLVENSGLTRKTKYGKQAIVWQKK